MPTSSPITRRQLVRLQVLWRLLAAQQGFPPGDREFRLTWVGGQIKRGVASFKELTRKEAELAIDALQRCLPRELITRRPKRRRVAKGQSGKVAELPRGSTLELIARFRTALQMDQARFEAWLRSRHGPLRGRVEIRTESDAQAVVSGLKQMLRRKERTVPKYRDRSLGMAAVPF